MKKLFIGLFLILGLIPFATTVKAESETTHIYVHYFRYEGDYDGWNVWMWQNQPEARDGAAYQFEDDDTDPSVNFGGKVAKIPLTGNLEGSERVGIIIRRGEWLAKDVEIDRFIDVPETSPNGIHHVYLVEGDQRIGTSIDDPDGPDTDPKFTFAYFTDMNVIRFRATETMIAGNLTVKADGDNVPITDFSIDGLIGTITLSEDIDFGKTYVIEGLFNSDGSTNTYVVTYDGIYDSPAFEEAYGYEGDLGVILTDTSTIFKIWAPVSSSVQLNLYDTGTPANLGGTDTPIATHAMIPGEKGTFGIELPGNLHGTYYTFSVTNGSATHEVMDPYAYAAGINGVRGMVVDFSLLNPDNWEYNSRPDNMNHHTDAIIYELQIRDLTSHESWNGSEENRARYLGLIESGTSYNGVSTGFDHIVELGVTHVQLLPFFDFGYVDESRVDEEGYNPFNWGYMPMNFNVLEGSFSANPFDGRVRIQEMKEVIMGFHEADIRIVMDVVYNHTGLTADSNFNLIVPGYYFRLNPDGSFSNGSGTGNETASERVMMRKFMIDSLLFWTEEFNISGFRFDLMALHDIETMNQIAEELHAIDPSILIYGEPWMGGSTPLPAAMQAGKQNLMEMPYIGAFNDDLRDAVKGSVFARDQGAFVQGVFSSQIINRVKYGIAGGTAFDGLTETHLSPQRVWHGEPYKTINYVTAHDNNTLHDKLHQTLEPLGKLDLLIPMHKQANAIVLTSQGVAFLHAGDEFLRSKPDDGLTQPQYAGGGFVHNSYESTDAVNQLRWDLKATEEGMDVFEYYKGLIRLRNEHPSFRMTTAIDIQNNLSFVHEDVEGVIAYTITNDASADAWETIFVAHNANQRRVNLRLPDQGGWIMVVNGETAGVEEISTHLGGSRLRIEPNTTVVLYQDSSIGDYNPLPIILLSVGGGLILIGGVGFFAFKRFKQ